MSLERPVLYLTIEIAIDTASPPTPVASASSLVITSRMLRTWASISPL